MCVGFSCTLATVWWWWWWWGGSVCFCFHKHIIQNVSHRLCTVRANAIFAHLNAAPLSHLNFRWMHIYMKHSACVPLRHWSWRRPVRHIQSLCSMIMYYLLQHHGRFSYYQQVEICLWTGSASPRMHQQPTTCLVNISKRVEEEKKKKAKSIKGLSELIYHLFLAVMITRTPTLRKGQMIIYQRWIKLIEQVELQAADIWMHGACWANRNSSQAKQWLTLSPLKGNAKHYTLYKKKALTL